MLTTTYLIFSTLATYSASVVKSNIGNFRGRYKSLYAPLGTPMSVVYVSYTTTCTTQQAHNNRTSRIWAYRKVFSTSMISVMFHHQESTSNSGLHGTVARQVQSLTWQFMSWYRVNRCAWDWESQWEWESHGNPTGIGQELNKTWEWEWESTTMGMGTTPIPMRIDSYQRLW